MSISVVNILEYQFQPFNLFNCFAITIRKNSYFLGLDSVLIFLTKFPALSKRAPLNLNNNLFPQGISELIGYFDFVLHGNH